MSLYDVVKVYTIFDGSLQDSVTMRHI